VAVMLSYIFQTRNLQDGAFLVWLIFLCSWGCDTCAYCVGMLFGKHKMSPKLSPKKSVEGAIGGAVFCALAAGLYGLIVQKAFGVAPNYPVLLISGLAIAVVSQIGDLVMSAIKRQFGVKDYGKMLPGHGGLLDRFDSSIAVTILLCVICNYFEVFYV